MCFKDKSRQFQESGFKEKVKEIYKFWNKKFFILVETSMYFEADLKSSFLYLMGLHSEKNV